METNAQAKTTWIIDPAHSEVRFTARHMGLSLISGIFREFSGGIEIPGDNIELMNAWFTAKADSLDTNMKQRDEHLRGSEFFDCFNHKELKFRSTSAEVETDSDFVLKGELTIKGNTKTLALRVKYGGTEKDMSGKQRAGYLLQGNINRHDFGLNWDQKNDEGVKILDDDIALSLNIEVVKQP